MPLLAIAALTIAICSGVTRTSYWPMAAWAVCGALSWSGTRLGVTRMGTLRLSPNPNLAACERSASAPTCRPSQPNEVLQDFCSASSTEALPPGPQGWWSSLGSLAVVWGSGSSAGPGIWVSSLNLPDDSAAAAVTSLNVEPGG